MGRSSRVWLTALLAVAMVAGQLPSYLTGSARFAAAVETLDQSAPVDPDRGGFTLGQGTGDQAAETVTAGLSGALTQVDWAIQGCTAGAILDVQIQGLDVQGRPNGLVLAHVTQHGPLTFDGSFRSFRFPTPASFTAGDRFAIVLSEVSGIAAEYCATMHGVPGDALLNASAYYRSDQNPTWTNISPPSQDDDWPFKTFVDTKSADVAINGNSVSEADPAHPQFSVNVVNFGPDAATGTTVTYTFTGPAAITGWNASQPGTCTHAGLTLSCPVTPFSAHAGYSNTIFVDRTGPGKITETATIHANEPDGRPTNNSSSTVASGELLYSVDSAGDGLSIIDLATNSSRFIGRLDPDITKYTTPVAMSVRPSDKKLFVWNNSDGNTNPTLVITGVLLTVDACTGRPTSVGSATGLVLSSLAFRSDGALFGLGDALYSIDPATGAATKIGTSLGATLGGAEFDPATGVLYGLELSGGRLMTVDTTTGTATPVATLSTAVGVVGSIVFAPDGHLMGSSIGGTLFDLDKTTGAVSNVRTISGGVALQGLGYAPPCASADVLAGLDAVPATVARGATVTLTATAKNEGPDTATGALIWLSIPNGLTIGTLPTGCAVYVPPFSTIGYDYTYLPTSTVIQCAAGSLARDGTATVSVPVTAATAGTFDVLTFASADQFDPNSDNNSSSATVTVVDGLIGVATCRGIVLPSATVELLSGTSVIATTIASEDGRFTFPGVAADATFGLRYTSVDGTIVCGAEVSSGEGSTTIPDNTVPNLHNSTWLTAYLLQGDGTPVHDYIATPRDAWFKFSINPGEQVIVSLRDCQFDCSLVLFTDIQQASDALQSGSIANVQQTQRAVAPAELSPAELSPAELSPAELSPAELSAALTTPAELSPAELSPAELSLVETTPAELSPAELSPAELSAAVYSSAQTASILAVSAHAGLSPELIVRNTWEHTGSFYARVLSHDGTTSQQPFTILARALPGACVNVPLAPIPSSLLAGIGAASTSTLYLTNSARLVDAPATATAPAMTVAQFMSRLHAFATLHGGTVVDFAGDSGVAAGQAILDAHTDCALAANTIADTINDVVQAYRANGGLQYIVIAGGDRAIPFRRVPDLSGLGTEDSYHVPVLDSSVSQAALKSRFFLSQDFYAAPFPIVRGNLRVYLPQEGIGRLVESPRDMATMLDAFDLVNGVTAPKKALSTGYDFIADLANDLNATFATEGLTTDALIEATGLKPTDPTAWTAEDLRAKLFGNATYDIYAINGHFAGNLALAADYKTLVGSDEVANLPASDLRYLNALVLSMGCHAGYSIVDQDGVPNLTQTVAWAEAWNGRGATVVGGTGYGYADTDFVQYSEKILSNTAKALGIGAGPVAIGDALVSAKTAYLTALAAPEGIDVKAASEATLYGLPMMKYDVLRPSSSTGGTPLSLASGFSSGLQYGTPVLSYALNPHTETGVPVSSSNATVDLTYYDASGDIQVTPLQPVLPRNVTRLSVPGTTVLRGGALFSAQYTEVSPILPRTDVATIEERGQLPTAFASVYTPLRLFSLNQIGDDPSLVVLPLQYLTDGVTGTARLYDAAHLNIRLYTSSRTDASALADAPSITSVVLTRTPTGVHVDALVGGLIAAGLEDVLFTYTTGADPTSHVGTWTSITLRGGALTIDRRLESGAGYSEHVSGDITTGAPDDVRLFVQAVSGNALVSVASNTGAYFRLQPDTNATPQEPKHQSVLAFTPAPPATVAYGATVSATVRLTDGGTGVDGKTIDFNFGGHHVKAVTAGGGFASANFIASFSPGGSPYLFTAAFKEDPTLLGSSLAPNVTITPATSTLSSSAVTAQYSDGATLAATLTGGGVGLNSELVIATINNGATVVAQRVTMTDGTGTARFDVRSFGEFAPGAYTATLTFGGNDVFGASSATVGFTRTLEDATIVITPPGPQPAGSVTVKATVAQTDAALGDLRRAIASFTFQPETGAAIVTSAAVAADGTVSVTLPLAAGVYTVSATVGGWFTSGPASTTLIMPVYDPTTFATGGGWAVTSTTTPAGKIALPLGKKGNFGFNVKYKDGTTTSPTGSLLFQLKEASIDLKATSFEWLVINGGRAEFQGAATINGSGGYSFRVIATQGTATVADRFEIRIWNAAGSFDAPTYVVNNTVGGGSLKVH